MPNKPTRTQFSALAQLCEWIPPFLVAKLARKHGVDAKARAFSPWSHVIALLYAQLVHAISLNDVCDGLRLHAAKLWRLREAAPPSRNGFSHANKVRPAAMAEELFWSVLSHLTALRPRFGGRTYAGMPRRFTRLFCLVRALVWDGLAPGPLLRSYGTAGGCYRMLHAPHQGYFPGFEAYFAPAGV